MIKQTRGERNNNPGNLDRNQTKWLGMAQAQPDSRFITFTEPKMGIRALAKTLLTYYHLHHLDTVGKIINRWAPTNENDTNSYVNAVADALSVEPDSVINVESPMTLELLVRAIIKHENGRVLYDDDTIQEAIDMAIV